MKNKRERKNINKDHEGKNTEKEKRLYEKKKNKGNKLEK